MDFESGTFAKLADSDLGKRLWAFLNEKESVIVMEAATYLSRPALEPLQPWLIERFKEELVNGDNDQLKRMIGRMVRQVMESRGYQLDQMAVRLRKQELFMSAARYVK